MQLPSTFGLLTRSRSKRSLCLEQRTHCRSFRVQLYSDKLCKYSTMSKTVFTTTSALVCPDLGKDGQVKGPFPALTVTAKRTVKDAEFSLAVPVHTASQSRSLNGTMLSVKSNYSEQPSMSPVNCRKLSWLVVSAVDVLIILPLRFVSVSTVNVAFAAVIGHALVFASFSISQACKPLLQTTWRPRLAWILGQSTRQLVHCTKRALMPLGESWT